MEPATSTFELINRIKSGDQEAFSQLFDKYRPRLAALIHYRLSPEQRLALGVDDILQETFFRGFRDCSQFTYQGPGSFLRWLSQIANHIITDQVRHQGRQKRQGGERVPFRSKSNPDGVELADSKTPSRILSEDERVRALLKLFDALPEDYRQVILLARIEGLSTEEIAERLGKPRQAITLLLHRAIKRLRELKEKRSQP